MRRVIFVTREAGDMPAVRVRCHGFSRLLQNAGIDAQVLSFADVLGAVSGSRESELRWRDKVRYNVRSWGELWPRDAVVIMQRVHYHSFGPFFVQALRRRPFILDLDDWEAREDCSYRWGWYPRSKAEWLIRRIAGGSCFCVAASYFLRDYLQSFNRDVLYVPTGVDVRHFHPEGAPAGGPVILSWAGTFHRPDNVENINFLLRVFLRLRRHYPDVRLEIRGDGRYRDAVRKLVEQSDSSAVTLLPWINSQDMPGYLDRVHIGVMPLCQDSKFNQAKSPTRLFEYMAMAKPVIASRQGEAMQALRHGEDGFLGSSPAEFESILSDLVRDEHLRQKVGQQARQTVCEKFSLEAVCRPLVGRVRQIV